MMTSQQQQQQPVPLLKGTLAYNPELKKSTFNGFWNYLENNGTPSQPFELSRYTDDSCLTADGVFNGSFNVLYTFTTSKGKLKSKSVTIHENDVTLKFITTPNNPQKYDVSGDGTNKFGYFILKGSATVVDTNNLAIELTKTYTTAKLPDDTNILAKPSPSPIYENDVVCLSGKLARKEAQYVFSGMWSSSYSQLNKSDDSNTKFANAFEYTRPFDEMTSLAGRWSGYFILTEPNGTTKRIQEENLLLQIRLNSKSTKEKKYYNVEGSGKNIFGRYNVSGTFDGADVLLFRHFARAKLVKKSSNLAAPVAGPQLLTLDDVKLDNDDVMAPPLTYSAVSRGVIKANFDGGHTCTGKWALTKEQFSQNVTSNFHFGLEAADVTAAVNSSNLASDKTNLARVFPCDSAAYRGTFQLKRFSTVNTIIDTQICLKFKLNSSGSYNLAGRGVNSIGYFSLSGVLVPTSAVSGQIEMFRVYDAEASNLAVDSTNLAPPPPVVKRSFRKTKGCHTRLNVDDDDDDDVTLDNNKDLKMMMTSCKKLCQQLIDQDTAKLFVQPVDPVALNIPTYTDVIKHPMDLSTILARLESGELNSPNEFTNLVRLVYTNAIVFNEEASHPVHVAAQTYLADFNKKVAKFLGSSTNLADGSKKRKRKMTYEELEAKKVKLEEIEKLVAKNTNLAPEGFVKKSEFDLIVSQYKIMVQQQELMQEQLRAATKNLAHDTKNLASHTNGSSVLTSAARPRAGEARPKSRARTGEARGRGQQLNKSDTTKLANMKPLSLEEQEQLTEAINKISANKIGGVIQIIRSSANLDADSEEIDLALDQLDVTTQRKLQSYMFQNKRGRRKKETAKFVDHKAKKVEFSFGDEEDDDDDVSKVQQQNNGFSFGDDDEDDVSNNNDDEDGDVSNNESASWGEAVVAQHDTTNLASDNTNLATAEAWEAAREEAAARRQQEANLEAEQAKLVEHTEKLRAQKLEKATKLVLSQQALAAQQEQEEAKLLEQKAKLAEEANKLAREAARKEHAVEQTVDLDEQRLMMNQYEAKFADDVVDASASPSSDFGF